LCRSSPFAGRFQWVRASIPAWFTNLTLGARPARGDRHTKPRGQGPTGMRMTGRSTIDRRLAADESLRLWESDQQPENQKDGHGDDGGDAHPQDEDASELRRKIKKRMGRHRMLLTTEMSE
jgi:hypothetical protein